MSLDFLAEDYRFVGSLLRKYAFGKEQDTDLFRAACSNNLNTILATLDLARGRRATGRLGGGGRTMSDTTLDHLHKRLADLRIDSVMIRGRIEELVQTIEMLERRRGGRPRKGDKGDKADLAIVPGRVAGGSAETETDEQGPLPSLDDVRGILKESVG